MNCCSLEVIPCYFKEFGNHDSFKDSRKIFNKTKQEEQGSNSESIEASEIFSASTRTCGKIFFQSIQFRNFSKECYADLFRDLEPIFVGTTHSSS